MEEELRRAKGALEERVAERTAELTRSNERLRHEMEERQRIERQLAQTQKLEAIGRLTGGIAHDFNNLMAIVIGNAGLLARRIPEGEPGRAFVDEIVAAGKRAAELTRQLLAFSRAQVVAREVLEPTPIVAELTRMLGRVIGEEVTVTTRLDEGAGLVEADRGQLEQVVMNLVVNGRDAMPAGGTLTIETARAELDAARATALGISPGHYVRLTVADTGTGMDEHVLAHLFDPFFTTKGDSGGTGLGLSTAYGIVRHAGGAIAVDSLPGRGSRFDVYLPRVEAPAVGGRGAGEARPRHGTETLLLAEDQERLLVVLARALREVGYTVLEAHSPADALRLAREHPGSIDLLLTDVIMPGMRGPDLAARVREVRPAIKVLFMSGYVDNARLDGIEQRMGPGPHPTNPGGAALIAKPFTPDALADKVRELLEH
jgi:signal transduction histidine kinase